MTTEEVIRIRIRNIQREIDDLERTKAVVINETARKVIDLCIENLRRETRKLEERARIRKQQRNELLN